MYRSDQSARISKAVGSSLLFAAVMLTLGCDRKEGLPLESVRGIVKYQGEILDHGQVVFLPQQGTPGPSAVGRIQFDGTFSMRTLDREGAAVGSHKVTVHCRQQLTEEEVRNHSLRVPESRIPEKYWKNAQTPLTFTVVAGETNTYDINLH